MRERRRAAIHEAAHAAVARQLGWRVESVELDPPRAGTASLLSLDPWRKALEAAVIDFAGHTAERQLAPLPVSEERDPEQGRLFAERIANGTATGLQLRAEYAGPGSDEDHAQTVLLALCAGDRVEAELLATACERRAQRLVHELRQEIEAVAAALLQHGRLDRVDVEFAIFGAGVEREREAVA